MGKFIDLTGVKFGRLTAIERHGVSKCGKTLWKCDCECGGSTITTTEDLKNGHTKSCGCLQRERTSQAVTKHRFRHTKIYHKWLDMKQRCFNPKNNRFAGYGGRGITVCEEWKDDFQAFYDWAMANGYADHLTIDRIDVNGHYEPSNCRWIPMEEQANNKTTSIFLEYEGETKTIAEWAKIKNIKYDTLLYRYHAGFSIEKIFYEGRLKNGTKSQRNFNS